MKYTHSANSGQWQVAITGSSGSESSNTSIAVSAATKFALGVEVDCRSGQNKTRFYDLSTPGAQTLIYETTAVSWTSASMGGIIRQLRTAGTNTRTLQVWWAMWAVDGFNL